MNFCKKMWTMIGVTAGAAVLSGCVSVEKAAGKAAGNATRYIKQLDEAIERRQKGLYYDESTGLMWYVCPVGGDWSTKEMYSGKHGEIIGCNGDHLDLDAQDTEDYIAQFINGKSFGGYSDWRLPTVYEVEYLGLANCAKWREEPTSTVLTERGREDIYEVATRTTLDNQGRMILVDDCANDSVNAFDRAFLTDYNKYRHRWEHPYGDRYEDSVRVKTSAASKDYREINTAYDDYYSGGMKLTNLKLRSDEELSNDEHRAFYIVRQHTQPKGSTQ